MREVRDSTIGAVVAQAATLLVLAQTVLFYSFVLRARVALGRWPYLYHPDPSDLGFTVHQRLVWLGFLALPIAPLLCGACYYAARELGTSAAVRVLSVVAFIAFAVAGRFLLFADPGGFGEWFVD